jgi:hypothetical protein
MDKKATFRITIESIIVLILGIVFLGLAITFVAVMFTEADVNLGEVFDTITKQRIEQLKLSENYFDLEKYTIDLEPGQKRIIFMLLRNNNNEEITWNINHIITSIGDDIDCDTILLSYKEEVDVQPGDESIPPLVIQTDQNINKGTCLFEINAESDSIETLELTVNII